MKKKYIYVKSLHRVSLAPKPPLPEIEPKKKEINDTTGTQDARDIKEIGSLPI